MMKTLLEGNYTKVKLHHVRMGFSADMDSVGKFQIKKVWILLKLIGQVLAARVRTGAKVLYYPPSGPEKVPVLRDIILLNCLRWAFKYTVFHFHAGGVSEFRSSLGRLLRWGFDRAYRKPALSIRTSELNPEDGKAFDAEKDIVVYNGLKDEWDKSPSARNTKLQLLFVGVLIASKGIGVLVEACGLLQQSKLSFELVVMGRFGSVEYEVELKERVEELGLKEQVKFIGVKSGSEKHSYFDTCDVFTFPSFFESESFGLVCVEAMMFGKPVVSTNWRGIPTVVKDGESGFLVPIQDAKAVAEKIMLLAEDQVLRKRMGAFGRSLYETHFTVEKFRKNMEQALASVH